MTSSNVCDIISWSCFPSLRVFFLVQKGRLKIDPVQSDLRPSPITAHRSCYLHSITPIITKATFIVITSKMTPTREAHARARAANNHPRNSIQQASGVLLKRYHHCRGGDLDCLGSFARRSTNPQNKHVSFCCVLERSQRKSIDNYIANVDSRLGNEIYTAKLSCLDMDITARSLLCPYELSSLFYHPADIPIANVLVKRSCSRKHSFHVSHTRYIPRSNVLVKRSCSPKHFSHVCHT
jgi:hypothetical protein